MTDRRANVDVQSNVMLVPERRAHEIKSLPGDLAFNIYGKWWPSPAVVRQALTAEQWREYKQYLVCHLCHRPCAGTCVDES
jgi:hypothetical protein